MREVDRGDWLGMLYRFPPVLHDRASVSYDISRVPLQRALFSALSSLQSTSIPADISVADRHGYKKGRLCFKVGIGNGEGFGILNDDEERRLLHRVENQAPFDILDLAFRLHYSINNEGRHKIHGDHYVLRLIFHLGDFDVLAHHLKGMRRVGPRDLVRLVLEELNAELSREHLGKLNLETLDRV